MSMEGDNPEGVPKSVISHSLDPVERFQRTMGWINFMYMSDKFFIATNAFMDLIGEVDVWLNDIKDMDVTKHKDFVTKFQIPDRLPAKTIKELKQIWYGNCYLYQRRSRHQEILEQKVIYNPFVQLENNESILDINGKGGLPALMHLNPRSKTKDDTDPRVLIQEPIRFDVAYDGFDADQLSQVFGFKWVFADGEVQMFNTDEQIMTSDALVMEISREAFHKMIRLLIMEFKPRRYFVYNVITNIMKTYRRTVDLKALQGVAPASELVASYS